MSCFPSHDNHNEATTAAAAVTTDTAASSNLDRENDPNYKRALGAGIAAGLCGALLAGPVLGTFVGLGAAYAAQSDPGVVGESARAVGDVALEAQAKAEEIEEEKHIAQRANNFLNDAWEKIQQLWKQSECNTSTTTNNSH
jgi:hypothetical protein